VVSPEYLSSKPAAIPASLGRKYAYEKLAYTAEEFIAVTILA
jgi:hypothetical protein